MSIGYGLVGLGGIAKTHLLGLRNIPLLGLPIDEKIELKGLYTTHPLQNLKLAGSIGFENVVESMEELVGIPKIDMVDLCTPNFLHSEQIKIAAQACKHIYCEKPLSIDRHTALEAVKAVEEASVFNQVAFVLRFLPSIVRARSLLKHKVVGKVFNFRAELYHSSYINQKRPMTWRLQKEKSGGGALVDLGSHVIDLTRFLLGEFETVQAFTDTIIPVRPSKNGKNEKIDVDDWALITAKLDSGAIGTIEVSRTAVGAEGIRIEIYGDKGSIFISSENPLCPMWFDENLRNRSSEIEQVTEDDEYLKELIKIYPPPKMTQGWMIDSHTASLVWFINSLNTGRVFHETPSFSEAYKTQVIMDCAYQSSEMNGLAIRVE